MFANATGHHMMEHLLVSIPCTLNLWQTPAMHIILSQEYSGSNECTAVQSSEVTQCRVEQCTLESRWRMEFENSGNKKKELEARSDSGK